MIAVFLLLSFFVAMVAAIFASAKKQQKAEQEIAEQFPPISDEEFVARCTPGVNPSVALKVRRIVARNLGVDYARLYPSTRFNEDLGVD